MSKKYPFCVPLTRHHFLQIGQCVSVETVERKLNETQELDGEIVPCWAVLDVGNIRTLEQVKIGDFVDISAIGVYGLIQHSRLVRLNEEVLFCVDLMLGGRYFHDLSPAEQDKVGRDFERLSAAFGTANLIKPLEHYFI